VTSTATRASRMRWYPWAATAGFIAIAFLLTFPVVGVTGYRLGSWWLLVLLFGVFVAAQAALLRLEVGRQSILVSLVEIPLVLSFFLLAPLGTLLVRVAAAAIVVAWRNSSLTKYCFNVALLAASTAVANGVMMLAAPLKIMSPIDWLVALAAVVAAQLVSLAGVFSVIIVVQGAVTIREMVRSAAPQVVGLACATVALVLLLAVRATAWSVALVLALTIMVLFAYRAYARFLDQHENLGQMYELTGAVRDADTEGKLADILLVRVRAMLRAEYATLWLPASGRYPELLLTAKEGALGLLDQTAAPSQVRQEAISLGRTVAIGPKLGESGDRDLLPDGAIKDIIAVPLRSGNAIIGSLECANRLGDRNYFNVGDVSMLEAIAAQTGVAVENTRLVDRLRFDAYHDRLTLLPNRARLVGAIDEAVQIAVPGEIVALLIFDVDGLHDVNDSLGHGAGDRLLAEVGKRLAERAPAGALAARVGGDEFGLLLRLPDLDRAIELAGELRTALQDPMPFGNSRLDVDTTVGIAAHPDHGSDPEMLLQRANLATNAAKGGRESVQVFNLGLESRSVRRLGLAGDLRRAIEDGELEVYFQPKVAIGHRELVGVECLARWKHPMHGWVSPEDFLPVAEHTGQLGRLTDLVLREGLTRCRQWADEGHPLTVAVNLSPRTLVDPSFVGYLEALIASYGVPPGQLTLEMTEDGMLPGTDRTLPTLRRLRDLGVRLSVDDFGTGYSSLSYLRRLPVQEVKIDRSFVQGMATDAGDYAIVRAVVDLSRHFGLEVVAEGVESELALSQLEEMGCDIGQGFYFSRPLSYERLAAWLAARTELMPATAGAGRKLRIVP
jgi:diguanylate cyclase (GGDEF)-like protein